MTQLIIGLLIGAVIGYALRHQNYSVRIGIDQPYHDSMGAKIHTPINKRIPLWMLSVGRYTGSHGRRARWITILGVYFEVKKNG